MDRPMSLIVGLTADSINQGTLITGLETQTIAFKEYVDKFVTLIYAHLENLYGMSSPSSMLSPIRPTEMTVAEDVLHYGEPELPATPGSRLIPSTPYTPPNPVNNTNAYSTFLANNTTIQSGRANLNLSRWSASITQITQFVLTNPWTSFAAGTGFTGFGIVYGLLQGARYHQYSENLIQNNLNSNVFLSGDVKRALSDYNQSNIIASNLIDMTLSCYNLGCIQGFINSNITTQQTIQNLKTSSLSSKSGKITSVSTVNATTGIYGTIATTNNGNQAIPSIGNFGG